MLYALGRLRRACVALTFLLFVGVASAPITAATPLPQYETSVLGPLFKMNGVQLNEFSSNLNILRRNGVDAIELDLWWGLFEPNARGVFDWAYYKEVARRVTDAGLDFIPILSFHECGGNVNDTCDFAVPGRHIPIPPWVNTELGFFNRTLRTCGFQDENGFINTEYIGWWCDDIVMDFYEEAIIDFVREFQPFADHIPRVHISTGPAGELRYPSYVEAAGWRYPQRGFIQAYNPLAIEAFQSDLRDRRGFTLAQLNARWGTAYASWNQVLPPSPGGLPTTPFSINQMYEPRFQNEPYVRDFWYWYSESLYAHGAIVLAFARNIITAPRPEGLGPNVMVAGKLAGVHWQMTNSNQPRAAEMAAGYWWSPGSKPYVRALAHIGFVGAEVVFTALELEPNNGGSPAEFSDPPRLVREVASVAHDFGMDIFAENALPMGNNAARYDRAALHLFNLGFSGYSHLRLNDLIPLGGPPSPQLMRFADQIAITPVPTRFEIQNVRAGFLAPGERLCLTGGVAGKAPGEGPRTELGAWMGEFCTPMTDIGGGRWRLDVHLSANKTFDFKYRVIDAGGAITNRWEEGDPMGNHQCTIGPVSGDCVRTWADYTS
jgi:beta-amylase